MPSPAGLVTIVKLVVFVVFVYYLSQRRFPSFRGIVAFVLLMVGLVGTYTGFTLAVREDSRRRYGRVVPGVVVEKYLPDHRGHTIATTGRQGPRGGKSGYEMTEPFARWMAYGSPAMRIVDYRYPCSEGRDGNCPGRDYVTPELWARLSVGDQVNVRQAEGETVTARLDENPQLAEAWVQVAISGLLLGGAGLISGRLRPRPRRHNYVTARAVVTAVHEIKYGDETRWKVHFAYFDHNGAAQESIDEVNQPTWKSGDPCVAVYRPEIPDLATLQPASQV